MCRNQRELNNRGQREIIIAVSSSEAKAQESQVEVYDFFILNNNFDNRLTMKLLFGNFRQ